MKRIFLAIIFIIILTGCGAMTGAKVKDHNLLSVFNSNMDHVKVADVIFDMSKYCSSGHFDIERNDFTSLNKSVVDYKIKNQPNAYYMHVEIEGVDKSQSKISVYHYMNTEVTRNSSKAVEEWVNNNTRTCEEGLFI